MARPLRDTDPTQVHVITCRTSQAEILLVPNRKLNRLLGGIIGKYAKSWQITLFAVCVLGNHYHILCQAPEQHLARFAADVNREITKRVNSYLGRRGVLWGRRYDDQVTIEEKDDLEGLLYVLTNPVKHGLVRHPNYWPGLSTYRQTLGGASEEYTFLNTTDYNAARRRARRGVAIDRSRFETKHKIEIAPLPHLAHLPEAERQTTLNNLIEQRTEFLVEERISQGLGFLGRKKILEQPPRGQFPRDIAYSPRPRCYTKDPVLAKLFRDEEREKRNQYTEASYRFRCGDLTASFPSHCYRPPLHYNPNIQCLPT